MSHTPNISVVTGAAGGIGTAIANALLMRGDRVVASDLPGASFDQLTEAAAAHGITDIDSRLLTLNHDVTSVESWADLRNRTHEAFGAPNILVNNAGISPKHNGLKRDGLEISLEEWQSVIDVNLTGAFLGIQSLVPAMKAAGYGRVINMASLAGRSGGTIGGVHYAATKTGILGVTRAFARELAAFGVTVNAVAPGRIDAGMVSMSSAEFNAEYLKNIPVRRMGTGSDVAHTVLYLSAPEAGFVTGTTTDINGGSHMQ